MAATSPTRIQLCGPLSIRVAGMDVTGALPGPQGRFALAYLLSNRARPVTRGELAEALWAQAPPAGAPTALRALLSKLRRALDAAAAGTLPPGDLLQLRLAGDAWLDVEAAAQALHDAQAAVAQGQDVRAWIASHVALNVSSRTFLAGCEQDWVIERRRDLEDLRVAALEALAACAVRLGGPELDTALRAARELVGLAPLRETGHAHLMRALAGQGNSAEALVVYEQMRVRLREELGAIPGPELQTLHGELLNRRGSGT